ncbi:MAG: PIG-L family deacetylase [Nitrospirales bacterium]|nr:PIG-L family deacetylase [Nitrospirales bacterium]
MNSLDILKKTVIVAAHPDDEILWFSSLLEKVDHVVLCYLGELANPAFEKFRLQALSQFPFHEKMSCLELMALGISRPKNFVSPKFSPFGVELIADSKLPGNGQKHYQNNYLVLRNKLSDILGKYHTVVTHNSWGEYGHEEHVQVYRVVKDLQASLGFDLWTSNYCSTRTVGLVGSIAQASQVVTLPTNPELVQSIMDIYIRHQCWTWYENWKWPAEETFFKEASPGSAGITYGSVLPVNLIVKPPLPSKSIRPESKLNRIRNFVGLGKGRKSHPDHG